jgi:hypothetical protein
VSTAHQLVDPTPVLTRLKKSWRYMLVHHRICELRDINFKHQASLWDGEWMVRVLRYDSDALEQLIEAAMRWFEDDDLDQADQYCLDAERLLCAALPKTTDNPNEPIRSNHII